MTDKYKYFRVRVDKVYRLLMMFENMDEKGDTFINAIVYLRMLGIFIDQDEYEAYKSSLYKMYLEEIKQNGSSNKSNSNRGAPEQKID